VEKAHEVFEEKMERELYDLELSEQERDVAFALVDRVYACFIQMFDALKLQTPATVPAELAASALDGLRVP
jgi:hypothetical protein